jgi:hypothetical protein
VFDEPALAADHLARLAEIIDREIEVVGQPVLVVIADRGLQFDDEGGRRIERLG